jgi:hypothetical protein
MTTPADTLRTDRIEVGDIVEFHLATSRVRGRVVEDRGPLGVGGCHVFRVDVQFDPDNTLSYELPVDLLRRVSS